MSATTPKVMDARAGVASARAGARPAVSLRRGCRLRRGRRRHEQILLVPDEIVLAVDRQLVVLAHEDRRHRARFLAVPAEDAPRLVDLVDLRVSRPGLDVAVVLGGLQVDGVGRAGDRADPARDALFQAVLVPHAYLLAALLG